MAKSSGSSDGQKTSSPYDDSPDPWEDERGQPTIDLYSGATSEMGWTVDV